MKAILEYTLPDDQHEYDLANSSGAMYNALHDIRDELRRMHKYGEFDGEQWEIVDKIYQQFHDILTENNIKL